MKTTTYVPWSVLTLLLVFSSADDLSFLLLGDWGKGGYGKSQSIGTNSVELQEKTSYQLSIAKAMGNYAYNAVNKPSFIVALGDNFYDDGVGSSTDTLWLYLWKYVYLLDYPELYIPWYPVLGNHDWNGAPHAQIKRFQEHTDDDIWMAESTNFTKSFPIPGTKNDYITIVFLDTTTLAPSETKATSQLSSSVKEALIQDQLSHLHSYLAAATTASPPPTWLFVAGHYPVFSRGEHGDIAELTSNLLPLLTQYGVDAYFSGHDHISEHLQQDGVDYFVAGAGSMTDSLRSSGSSAASLVWSGTGYSAFAVVDAGSDHYTVRFIDANNEVKYEATTYKSSAVTSTPDSPSPTKAPTLADIIHYLPPSSNTRDTLTSFRRMPAVVIGGTALSLFLILTLGYVVYKRSRRNSASTGGTDDVISGFGKKRGGGRKKFSNAAVPKSVYSSKNLNRHRLLSLGLQAIQYEEVEQQAPLSSRGGKVNHSASTTSDVELGGVRSGILFDKSHSTYMPTSNNDSSGKHKRAVSMPV